MKYCFKLLLFYSQVVNNPLTYPALNHRLVNMVAFPHHLVRISAAYMYLPNDVLYTYVDVMDVTN